MSFFSTTSTDTPKDRYTIYSEFFDFFGSISNIDDFIDRFEKHLICGKDPCDCNQKYDKMKKDFIKFEKLAFSLNEFCKNTLGLDEQIFQIGMIPNNLAKLEIDDLHQNSILGNWNKEKIQFDEGSLCIYGESNNSLNHHPSTQHHHHNHEKDFVVIYNSLHDKKLNISVAGRDMNVSFLKDTITKCRAEWSSDESDV